ncbi:TPA: GNAT family N-acetyltransferase [Staphylococcus pseudintermedius]|uniref:GNAT family N-acetyltransferase n=1 Tax=Staphylococcus pseudintermedius TaxID=283734 RepID=UPI001654D3D8|nr:GNAT family N-acetyltransferase [Staphylococcus pseudintermedius]EGQ1646724.1 GNAT family N-acetyltransferase [Staphylococcus pseudintermedius]EIA5780505.1 GNAT family N-acetyltransferase [Staphylococcus pseudintermedius]EIX6372359.1 GNAT family N-acetyltransferase [Staphylococcus pseudintermedius]EJG5859754.1 GNAT family N-acetyltransferase [Staphylococcus pseudintermedius]EJQ7840396.1 GNAT family N-acetyltransferase [Staphylococcus pseudintermedius]
MYEVRIATPDDVIGIRDVATKAWYNTYLNIYAASTVNELLAASYNEEHLRKRLEEQLFMVAIEGQEVVGFANFIQGSELYLSAHYVRPHSQNKGYGRLLLEQGLAHYEGQYDVVYLEVDTKNEKGVAFYEQEGFEIIRTYEHVMYGETMNLALMKKPLS